MAGVEVNCITLASGGGWRGGEEERGKGEGRRGEEETERKGGRGRWSTVGKERERCSYNFTESDGSENQQDIAGSIHTCTCSRHTQVHVHVHVQYIIAGSEHMYR